MDNNNNIITEHIDRCNEHTIYPEYFSTIIQNGKRLYRHRKCIVCGADFRTIEMDVRIGRSGDRKPERR